jgi:hypothetical protein
MSQSLTDRIRELAYQKWEQAGRPPGDGKNFWDEAEKELTKKTPYKAAAKPTPPYKIAAKKSPQKP